MTLTSFIVVCLIGLVLGLMSLRWRLIDVTISFFCVIIFAINFAHNLYVEQYWFAFAYFLVVLLFFFSLVNSFLRWKDARHHN
jgi:hypothetical protein